MVQDHCADSRKYGQCLDPLERSNPELSIQDLLEATEPMKPFPWDKETDMGVGGALADFSDKFIEKITSIFK